MSDRGYHGGGRRDYRGHGRGHYGGGGGGGHRRDHGDRQYGGGHRGGRGGYGGRGDYRREGGGGYRGGGGGGRGEGRRGGGNPRYQSSYVGHKRGRDEPEPVDPKKQLIQRLIKLGEPVPLGEDERTMAGDTPEKTFENAVTALKQQIKYSPDELPRILIEAVTSCSHKTMHYALLIGMVNVDDPDWVKGLTEAAGNTFAQQLAEGQVNGPRLLLRFFAALTHASVLLPADVLSLMERIMEVAQAHAAAGVDPSGSTWQPWTDQLVYAVLAGLVWGGAKLAAAEEEHARVMEAAAAYMAARPIQESVELRPMFGAADATDASAASDSGGASFLGQLWQAVQALSIAENPWVLAGLPLQLAESLRRKLDGTPVELPPINLPPEVPGVAAGVGQMGPVERAEVALQLQDRYPPRGGMVILDAQYTDAGRAPAERFVAEEYILDLLNSWEGYRVELVQMLCNSLPLPYDYSGLLCETLFAQLLRLPTSRLSPLAFSGLIAHAALLRPAFPKYLAGSVRQLFLRVEFLAPELVGRLAEVLAHFITNMGFRWPWDKYRMGLDQAPGGPQRTFLVLVLQQLVRLTAWDHPLLRQETPAEFLALLGEAPAFQGLPRPVEMTRSRAKKLLHPEAAQQDEQDPAAAVAAAANGGGPGTAGADAMQQDGDAAAAAANGGDAPQQQGEGEGAMDVDQPADAQQQQGNGDQQQQQQQAAEEQDPIALWSGKLLGVLQARYNIDHKPFSTEQVLLWMEQEQIEAQLGSAEAVLRVVAAAVLAAGSKSCTHVNVLLERYSHLLQQQMQALGQEQGQEVLLDVLGHMYSQMPTRLHIALSRLMELELLRPTTVISWLAAPERLQLGPASQEGAAADSWAMLNGMLQEVFARHQGAVEAQARMSAAVAKAENLLALASEEAAAAAEEQERAAAEGAEGGDAAAGGRQRIPTPGGRGPVSRLQMAKMREDAASRKVTAAQQDVARQGELLQRLEAERSESLLTVFNILSGRIAEAAEAAAQAASAAEFEAQQQKQQQQQQDADMAAADAEGADAADQQQQDEQQRQQDAETAAAAKAQAARQLVLAQVRGFSMAFRSQVVALGLTQRVLQAVENANLEADLRAALLAPLGLA